MIIIMMIKIMIIMMIMIMIIEDGSSYTGQWSGWQREGQGIHFETAVIGQGRKAGGSADLASLLGGVVGEGVTVLDDFGKIQAV